MHTLPSCPRCGYDQSGAIAAWELADPPLCPLDATCPECGLEFDWRDVLNPIYSRQLRMFEHARNRLISSFLRTWWKSSRPGSFWRWLMMEHEIVPRRLVAFSLIGFVLTYAIVVGLEALRCWAIRRYGWTPGYVYIASGDYWRSLAIYLLYPFGRPNWRGNLDPHILPLELATLLAFVIVPASFVLLPRTLRRARVRGAHIARVWAYSLSWTPLTFMLTRVLTFVWNVIYLVLDASRQPRPLYMERAGEVLVNQKPWFTLIVTSLWLVTWWSLAARRYLRLPHAWAIGAAMVLLSLLLSILLLMIYPGGTWFMFWL